MRFQLDGVLLLTIPLNYCEGEDVIRHLLYTIRFALTLDSSGQIAVDR